MTQTTAVAKQPDAQLQPKESPFEPRNLQEALKLSEFLAKSDLIPQALRGKPGDVMVVMMKGRELGLAPMQALSSIHVIEGKACLSSDLLQALVLRGGECEYFQLVSSSPTEAVYETKRKGAPNEVRLGWTIEQAKAAGLAGKHNWKAYPAAMLRARAAADLARDVYPDAVAGLYDMSEAEEIRGNVEAREAEVLEARPKTVEQLTARLKAELEAPPAEPQAAPEQEADPFAEPSQDAAKAQPVAQAASPILDPANPDGFAHRMRLGQMPQAWEAWKDEKVFSGMLKDYTAAQVLEGSHGGKRHKCLASAVKWAQAHHSPETMPAAHVFADYCLALMEERWAREGQA